MAYCFVCDAPVDEEVCPTCGTDTWSAREPAALPPATSHEPVTKPQSPPQPADAPTQVIEEAQAGGVLHLDSVPELVDRTPVERTTSLPRWPLAAVLVLALVLVAIRIPSGREDVQDDSLGELSAPATPLPEPQSYNLVWVPSDNTTVAVLGEGDNSLLAIRRYGPLDPIYASSVAVRGAEPVEAEVPNIVDVTPHGLAVSYEREVVSLWSPSLGLAQQLANDVTATPVLSPDGRLLAVPVDRAIFVYAVHDASPGTNPAQVAVSAVSDIEIEAVHWSPDGRLVAGATEDEWVLFDAASGVTEARGTGKLLAVGGSPSPRLAVQVEDDIDLRSPDGTIERTWPDILPVERDVLVVRGEFSPNGLYLAIQTARPEDPGVWVFDLIGRNEFRVGSRPGIGSERVLAWSGSGQALYWLDGRQLVAWLASTRQTVLVAERDDVSEFPDRINGIRMYDSALVPAGSLRERPTAPHSVMADGVVLTRIGGSVVAGQNTIEAPSSVTLSGGARVMMGETQRWGVEFAEGQVAFQTGPEWTSSDAEDALVDGSSLTTLADQFVWVAGGDLYSEASFPDPLLTSDQIGNGELKAVVGVRDSLVVVFQDADNIIATLWQIPGWSDSLTMPFVANRGAALPASPFPLNVVWRPADEFRMIRNLQQDAFAVTSFPAIPEAKGQVFFYPDVDVSSVCGVQLGACQGPLVPGEALTFSPDGHWVLSEREGPNWAVSTRGRGTIALDEDIAIWQP